MANTLSTRRAPIAAIAVLAAVAVSLLLVAEASAGVYRGQTTQGRAAKLNDSDSTGVPQRFIISWRTKNCNRPTTTYTDRTTFRGFRRESRTGFASRGSYRFQDGQFSGRVRVRVGGQRRSRSAWTGGFRARVRVFRNGNQYDRCRLNGVGWRVRKGRGKLSAQQEFGGSARSYSG